MVAGDEPAHRAITRLGVPVHRGDGHGPLAVVQGDDGE